MKLGFVSAILPEYSLEQLVCYAAEIKMECMELMCWPVGKAERRYAGVTHIDVETLDAAKAEDINGLLQEKNMEISALGYYPNTLDPDLRSRERFIAHIKKCIAAANLLGVKNFNTFVGNDQSKPLTHNMQEFKKVWPDIIRYAEDHDVKIGTEIASFYYSIDEWPGGKNMANAPKVWEEMFSVIDSDHFGLNYDPSHLVWQRMDYVQPIYDFADKIFHFHIKDAKFYQDRYNKAGFLATPLEYHAPKLPGLGDIDWGRTISALYDIHYKKWALIEVEDRAFEDSLEDRLYSIELSQRYMRNFI